MQNRITHGLFWALLSCLTSSLFAEKKQSTEACRARLDKLRVTQLTFGKREVERRARNWKQKLTQDSRESINAKLRKKIIPVVRGPRGSYYMIDHHHYAYALMEAGLKEALIEVIVDWSHLSTQEFWEKMNSVGWAHAYDQDGEYVALKRFLQVKTLKDLKNDEYRSLAGMVRDRGGFSKMAAPYSEFIWAEFFRHHFSKKDLRSKFDRILKEATQLAQSKAASHLPGWTGGKRNRE